MTRHDPARRNDRIAIACCARRVASRTGPKFDNLKIGYDNNDDDDIDDAGDDVVINEPFTSSSVTPGYDHAGNLIDDGHSQYVYDAWNRLVKVRSAGDTDVTIQTAEFFADGRRARKDVSHSGVFDTAEVYLYDGQKIIETRDGSGNATKQFIHGTQYIDELLMVRVMSKGEFYVHQDANWNVIALTNLRGSAGGAVVERYVYTPYGEVNVMQATSFGDRDGDEDVDSTDKGTVGTTCTGTVTGECRILDLDFDGDYDATDAGFFDYLPQGVGRHPGKFASGVDQPFHHQGLLFEPEVRQYQNRARQYDPGKKRFGQRDPLGRNRKGRNAFADGLDLYLYQRSSPINLMDFDGHAARKCKSVQCHCSHGDITVPLTGNSSFAGLVIGIGFGSGSQGCVTLPGHIYCNMSCSAIRSSGILCHECCHACAAADGFLGFFRWVGTWIGDLSGYCEDNAVPYEGGTCGSAPAV